MNKKPKMRVLYEETYAKEAARIKSHLLPTLPHVTALFRIVEAFITKAGRVERDGEELEFQDLRIYLKPATEGR